MSQSSSTSINSAQPTQTTCQDSSGTRSRPLDLASPTPHTSHNTHLPPPSLHDNLRNEVAPTQLSFASPRCFPARNSSETTPSNTSSHCPANSLPYQHLSPPALHEPLDLQNVLPSSREPPLHASPSHPTLSPNHRIIDQHVSHTNVAAESTTTPADMFQPHPQPSHTEDPECNDTEPRICWCLQQSRPPNCKHCFPPPESDIRPSRCKDHEIILRCVCDRPFHRTCVWSILHHNASTHNTSQGSIPRAAMNLPSPNTDPEYTCVECLHNARSTHDLPWSALGLCSKKNLRYGLTKPNRHVSELSQLVVMT